jgi:hypothetical protein
MFGLKRISKHESKIPCCAVIKECNRQSKNIPIMSMAKQRKLFRKSPESALRVLTTNISNIDLAIDTTWNTITRQLALRDLGRESDKEWIDIKVEYLHQVVFDLIRLRDFVLDNRCL